MEYHDEILKALQDERRFVRLTFSQPAKGSKGEWLKVTALPVLIGAGRRLQFVFQGPRKQIVRNVTPADAGQELAELLKSGFSQINLQCSDGDLHIRITAKGKALTSRGKPSRTEAVARPHDRKKEYPFPEDEPNEFLEAVGIMRNGRVVAAMRDKFMQINRFLALLGHTKFFENPPKRSLRLLDCGCGRALLTFAACHYLRTKRNVAAKLIGIDDNAEVIAAAEKIKARTGLTDVTLIKTRISDYQPSEPPDVVISLHACDTATDEALALGVKQGSSLILAVPCCQHELHKQLKRDELRAALRHGILRERMADITTDALRAAALRVMGYSAEVMEFISPEHTGKNLMLRAEKERKSALPGSAAEYAAMRKFWDVVPAIERLLGAAFESEIQKSQ